MTSRRVLIHCCFSGLSVLDTGLEKSLQFWNRFYDDLGQVLNVNSAIWVLFNLQRLLLLLQRTISFLLVVIPSKFGKQIENLFVVDLEVGASNQKLLSVVGVPINEAEDVAY